MPMPMPISNPWVTWAPKKPPAVVGVYELGHMTFGEVRLVYIGQGSIQARIKAHSRDSDKVFEFYRCLRTCDRRRARQIERREQRRYREDHAQLPAFNHRIG